MVVSPDRRTALVGWYRVLNEVNGPYHRVKLQGLDPALDYAVDGGARRGGDELMRLGLITSDSAAGERLPGETAACDFDSHIFVLKA